MRILALPLVLGAVIATAGCATPATPGSGPVDVDVVGQGTVLQAGDAAPQFCLGAVAESYPPQCSGPELTGWDWSTVDGQETASGVTWGTYAVWGNWDGTSLAVSGAIQLALYDPLPVMDPALDPDNAGTTAEADLVAIRDGIAQAAPVEVLESWVENGYLFVRVLHDDGAVQQWADSTYGEGVVQVRSALAAAG